MKNSKRRGAVKVPNIILRPAQASSSRSNTRQSSVPRVGLCEDSATDEAFDLTSGSKPFYGIVLCATGDLDKRTLFLHAQEMGAARSNDFTDKVTHLIADAPGSAKYKCAVERNLPILKGTWVEEAYHTWLKGDVVDLEQTMFDHRLPIFSGVKLCITGMEDVNMRSKIHVLLAKEGGVYLKSLDATATHLLCCASDNSAKLKWARDYNQTQIQTNRIRTVWEEWFWDSIEFGGRWDESDYYVTQARPSRKSLLQLSENIDKNSNTLPTATLSERTSLPFSVPTSTLLGDDPPEYGQTYKQRDVGLHIFQTIIQNRGYFESDNASPCSKNNNNDMPEQFVSSSKVPDLKSQCGNVFKAKLHHKPSDRVTDSDADSNSVLTRLSNHRATSFARCSSPQPQSRQPFRRIVSSLSGLAVAPQTSSLVNSASTSPSSSSSLFFTGYTFRAFGEAKGSTLRVALEEHGGQWLTEDEEQDADFFVVRLVSGGMFWQEEDDENERAKYRTECWVEQCIFEERICAPNEHVTFTPLKINTPVEGSENLHVSLSGLDSAQTCWTKRLVRAIGGNLPLTFSRRSTHLVCPSGRGAKFEKAREWGVSVVGMEWLLNIVTNGQIPPTKELQVVHDVGQDVSMSVDDTVGRRMDIKGKGQEQEEGTRTGEGQVTIVDPPISETGGLRTAITALLGKRGTEVRGEVDGLRKLPDRATKRTRLPSRGKTDLEPGRGLSPALSFVTGSPPSSGLSPHEGGVFWEEGQSSLRVVYEDPGQRAEKRKLIALFDDPGSGDGKGAGEKDLPPTDGDARTAPKKKLIRRSTRSSGV